MIKLILVLFCSSNAAPRSNPIIDVSVVFTISDDEDELELVILIPGTISH